MKVESLIGTIRSSDIMVAIYFVGVLNLYARVIYFLIIILLLFILLKSVFHQRGTEIQRVGTDPMVATQRVVLFNTKFIFRCIIITIKQLLIL